MEGKLTSVRENQQTTTQSLKVHPVTATESKKAVKKYLRKLLKEI